MAWDSAASAKLSLGQYGGQIINDATPWTGNCAFFQVINDAVLASNACPGVVDTSKLNAITLAEGTFHYGPFTAITLTSGVIKVFNEIEA